jgi:putative transport protein
MNSVVTFFVENPLVLLFSVIGLGYLIGNIRIGGFSLGVATVLFVGIAFGAIDHRLDLPEYVYVLGLVLFVYAIGLQSGPGFFASFQKRGLKLNLFVVSLLLLGAIVAVAVWAIMKISAPSAVGLFCGSLTNTPALAATVESVKRFSASLPPEAIELYTSSPVVTYGLAYPFGVLGVILWFFLASKFFHVDLQKESQESETEIIISRTFRITNPAAFGKSVGAVMDFVEKPGFVCSRIRDGAGVSIAKPETLLHAGDLIIAVGTAAGLERARLLFGDIAEEQISTDHGIDDGFGYRRIFVSSKSAVGKSIRELQLQKKFDATITRLRRGDVDFVPSPSTILELGDRIRVVTRKDNFDRITHFFGDSIKSISETDFLSLSLGIVLGVFLGTIPIPFPNGTTFKLGFAGGPLIVALILGRLERTGPITWSLPFNANLVLRQVGLVFFLAAIGTKAGHGFAATFQTGGWGLIAAGAILTTITTLGAIIIGYRGFKLPMSAVMGVVSGMQTQPACLAYANQQAQNDMPNVWYATVYPASMIAKILLAQILISVLLMM